MSNEIFNSREMWLILNLNEEICSKHITVRICKDFVNSRQIPLIVRWKHMIKRVNIRKR